MLQCLLLLQPPPSLNAPAPPIRPIHMVSFHVTRAVNWPISRVSLREDGGRGTQVGVHFLINTLFLRVPSGTRWVLNGGTGRDVTGARGVWSNGEKLKNWELTWSQRGCLILFILPSLQSVSVCCCNECLAENEAFTWMEALDWLSICIDMQHTLLSPPLWPVTVALLQPPPSVSSFQMHFPHLPPPPV